MSSIKVSLIILLFSLTHCVTKHSDIEICFEHVQNRIKPDSLLKKLMNSPVDSYGDFASIINRAFTEETKSDSICVSGLKTFLLEKNENSITVNNLILFQQFQAFLKHETFNLSEAKDKALKYEAKWK